MAFSRISVSVFPPFAIALELPGGEGDLDGLFPLVLGLFERPVEGFSVFFLPRVVGLVDIFVVLGYQFHFDVVGCSPFSPCLCRVK
jgi:hypothetical protein